MRRAAVGVAGNAASQRQPGPVGHQIGVAAAYHAFELPGVDRGHRVTHGIQARLGEEHLVRRDRRVGQGTEVRAHVGADVVADVDVATHRRRSRRLVPADSRSWASTSATRQPSRVRPQGCRLCPSVASRSKNRHASSASSPATRSRLSWRRSPVLAMPATSRRARRARAMARLTLASVSSSRDGPARLCGPARRASRCAGSATEVARRPRSDRRRGGSHG